MPVEGRRRDRVPGPGRPTGKNPRLPGRARRDRVDAGVDGAARLAKEAERIRVAAAPLSAADLTYSYREVSQFGPWARHRGSYTRYGEVKPLLTDADDRYVIFGAGEETALNLALGGVR